MTLGETGRKACTWMTDEQIGEGLQLLNRDLQSIEAAKNAEVYDSKSTRSNNWRGTH